MMQVSIRKFEEHDIPNKIKWVNDPENNRFLHYDLPLEYDKTVSWFAKNKDSKERFDAVICVDDVPVGLIGLLSISEDTKDAEYYILIGDRTYLGKGIALKASKLLLSYAFSTLMLRRVYLFVEVGNSSAIHLYERLGFVKDALLKNDLVYCGRSVDRYKYFITKDRFYSTIDTPIHYMGDINGNEIFVKREDFIPFSFGGNKARKARLFFEIIDNGCYDSVVTYGSSSSNHCRVVANMAAKRNMPCYIISPIESAEKTHNSVLMKLLGAQIVFCSLDKVSETIDNQLSALMLAGKKPYFIQGGGHGNIGTQAYVDCYDEIVRYEKDNDLNFRYVFHASGTGTTQAGLVCGAILHRDEEIKRIVGISIARKNPRGRNVVLDSIKCYLSEHQFDYSDEIVDKSTVFIDNYVDGGYGNASDELKNNILNLFVQYGIPFDSTYTGKAFCGMLSFLKDRGIVGEKVLFIHTGGTPLFFDNLI